MLFDHVFVPINFPYLFSFKKLYCIQLDICSCSFRHGLINTHGTDKHDPNIGGTIMIVKVLMYYHHKLEMTIEEIPIPYPQIQGVGQMFAILNSNNILQLSTIHQIKFQ